VEDDLTVSEREATLTVPNEALDFANSTDIDLLAIAIGTAHGEYKGVPDLDFERLKEIKSLIDKPLVLHGASGVPDLQVKKAISYGISKINIATELKIAMADAIKGNFANNPKENDPRNYMGDAKKAVKEIVKQKIALCAG